MFFSKLKLFGAAVILGLGAMTLTTPAQAQPDVGYDWRAQGGYPPLSGIYQNYGRYPRYYPRYYPRHYPQYNPYYYNYPPRVYRNTGWFGSPAWYHYCRKKYRSFNPRTGMYKTYRGTWRYCR